MPAPGSDIHPAARPAAVHECSFPPSSPGGTFPGPGPCECGKTRAQGQADDLLTQAALASAGAYPLPEEPFLTGVRSGTWHAIRRDDASWTIRHLGRYAETTAACGQPARLTLKWPGYRRTEIPVTWRPCPECAWIAADARGDLAGEVQRLIPAGDQGAILARLIPDPMIAATAAAMVTEAAAIDGEEHQDPDGGLHPATIQLLGAITRHAPAVLYPLDCAEGDCGHGGTGRMGCPEVSASAACPECSLRQGPWAGELDGTFWPGLTTPAPCPVLIMLAAHATVLLDEAKRRHGTPAGNSGG